jgi:hypothetical protein
MVVGASFVAVVAAIPSALDFVTSNRDHLLSHFGEAGTAVLAVKQVEYGHDRTLA